MLKLSDFAGRLLRTDRPEDLGKPTSALVAEAIDAGRTDEAKRLAALTFEETKSLHDLYCDWVWDLLSKIGEKFGESEVYAMLRATQETWMLRRTWKAFRSLSVERQVQLTAEMMRAHRSGPKQDGELEVTEDDEKFTIVMDPCGSGGRMRRGDPVDNTPSRLGPPYNFGKTKQAHAWSWSRKDVPYYCVHCAVNEILPIEWGGYPLWVTGYEPDERKPCRWYFYKKPELIPEEYWRRLGKQKPATFDDPPEQAD